MNRCSFISDRFADRIGGRKAGQRSAGYKFERIKRAKAEAIRRRPDLRLIDLGVGEPDEGADASVIEELCKQAGRPENRGYADNGIEAFKRAASGYMERVYGVRADADHEVTHVIGSKSAFAMLPYGLINPGDVALVPAPGYPIIGTHTEYCGGRLHRLPLRKENGYLPDLRAVSGDVLEKAKLLYLNYPNNPTGACATEHFFKQVVDFALRHGIVVIHDAAYAALTYDGRRPLSFLSVPGAKEVGLEVHSLSKAFNMTGWRIGFAVGNERLIRVFREVKDQFDSGQFMPVQHAGTYALQHPELTERIAEKYSRRLQLLADVLKRAGFDAVKPSGSFFLYVGAPVGTSDGRTFASAEEAALYLLEKGMICTVPWDDCGAYLRFSVTFQAGGEEEERKALSELERRLDAMKLIF